MDKVYNSVYETFTAVQQFQTQKNLSTIHYNHKLEKGFQKKPIVAFTNSTVFILDFNI